MHSLRFLQIEAVLSSTVLAMPIMNVFFAREIGMNMSEVGLSQAAFTLALLICNVPTGWLADRFSRKFSNMFGDAVAALGYVGYAFASTLSEVIIYEIVIGIGLSFSFGADSALLRAYSENLGLNYQKVEAQTNKYKPLGAAVAVLLGGVIGAHSSRLALGLTAATYGVGCLLSYFMVEAGERRITERHPVRDMLHIGHRVLYGEKQLAWVVFARAFAVNSTHSIIWVLTPLLVLAEVPLWLIGTGWAVTLAGSWLGAHLAQHYAYNMSDMKQYGLPVVLFAIACAVLAAHVSLATIWLYACFGVVRGWYGGTMTPMIQRFTPPDQIATTLSVADSTSRLMYVPLVWGLSSVADSSPQLTMAVNFVVFVPLMTAAAFKLRP